MAVINLAEAEILRTARKFPVVWSACGDVSEPWFDYDEEGNPQDFGMDEEPPDPTSEELADVDLDSLLYNVSPAQFAETAIRIPEAGRVGDFSFTGREYLRKIYDTSADRVLLTCGRQVEKCGREVVKVLTPDGRAVRVADMEVGDKIVALELIDPHHQRFGPNLGAGAGRVETTWRFVEDAITDKKPAGARRVLKVVTRMGSEVEVSEDTPLLASSGWLCAGELEIGDRLAAARDLSGACHFGGGSGKHPANAPLLGYALADGGLSGWSITITKQDPIIRQRIMSLLESTGSAHKLSKDGRTLIIDKHSFFGKWLEGDGLLGKVSREKSIPGWVFFNASREEVIDFIKALWIDCDGSVKQVSASKWEIVYASTSRVLAEQVRTLLLKFGIPSRIRRNNHPAYRDNPDPDVDQHLVRVETVEGVNKFLDLFTEHASDLDVVGDSNRDTIPKELAQPLIRHICDDYGFGRRGVVSPMKSWGLRITLKYPPSRGKLRRYLEFFKEYGAWEHPAYDKLMALYRADTIWDEVVGIEDLGKHETFHLEVGRNHNYVQDHVVVHNSTTLGNRLLCYSALTNNFRSLYVAPSAEQAKVFSTDRIKDVIEASPLLKAYTTSKISQAVFFKKFINFSQIRLRYAYLTADRVRGIPADLVTIDELQDILVDNIPVIEQCAFHSRYKIFLYSGTPKSLDNTLEHYRVEFSTQNEWAVPCERHGTPKDKSSWHWNILGEKNIGKNGLMCDRCGGPIDASHPDAQWVALNPRTENNKDKVTFDGYRIPQIMVQWVDWDDILQAQEQYSRAQFMNEKLGMSYDSGVRPITRGQLKACCRPEIRLTDIEEFKRIAQGRQVYAGIDWGCHDEETRILTQDGWKHFADLSDHDEVAQWDEDTRVMSFVKPEVRTVREWDGHLYHFETRGGLDMMLTGTHRMRVGNSVGARWTTETAEQTVARAGSIKFVGQVDWEGIEQEEFVLPGLPVSPGYQGCAPVTFKMDDWLEFVGYVLSEGGICLVASKSSGELRPYCIKMSQRETVSPEKAKMIKQLMDRMAIPYTEFPNHNTGDLNWTIYGKQLWSWFAENMGYPGNHKRIPRQFLSLSKRQLQILFDALVAGDGYVDPRDGCDSGAYYSTSKGLCEDFQELCIRLGRRCLVRLHKPAEGNRKTRWRAMWSAGRDYHLNAPRQRVKKVPYLGRVYCCKVPSGYIVTERNGCVSYQGNTGENASYTVMTLGGYFGTGAFSIFWIHRFTGQDLEPERQLDLISQILSQLQVQIAGVDYGGGFYQNDQLIRRFGPSKIMKYQYNPRQKKKIYWEPNLGRWMCHRTEIMSDVFNAYKRQMIALPCWEDFREPHGVDVLNIFSEYNERLRMDEYKHAPGKSDDAFHSILYCLLASMIQNPRPDILSPMKDDGSGGK